MSLKHLYITGFMGAGKSKIGRALADRLKWLFMDTDAMIEQHTGLTIRTIFEQYGEPHFRELEVAAVKRASQWPQPAVISLGGGALINEQNRRIIRQTGWLIYVKSSPQAIAARIKNSKKRPLLHVSEQDNYQQILLQKIRDLLAEREPVYQQADFVLDRDGLEWDQAALELEQLLLKSGVLHAFD